VLKRELPSPASMFAAGTIKNFDLMIARIGLLQKNITLLKELNHA
jgi:hypothetical protein